MYAVAVLIAVCSIARRRHRAHVWVEAFKIPSGSMIPTLQRRRSHLRRQDAHAIRARRHHRLHLSRRSPTRTSSSASSPSAATRIEIRDNVLVLNGTAGAARARRRRRASTTTTTRDRPLGEAPLRRVGRDARRPHLSRDLRSRRRAALDRGPVTVPAGQLLRPRRQSRQLARLALLGLRAAGAHQGRRAQDLVVSEGPDGVRWDRIDQPRPVAAAPTSAL